MKGFLPDHNSRTPGRPFARVALIGCAMFSAALFPAAALVGVQPKERTDMNLQITSSAFTEGQPIPAKYTCQGKDVSPPLQWSGVPPAAKSLALICDDPD